MRIPIRLMCVLAVAVVAWFMVGTASAASYFSDTFTYADGPITNNSGGVWNGFSGSSPLNVSNGQAIVSQGLTQDVAAQLGGGVHSNDVLYAKFDFNFSVMPGGSNATSYFFMFKDSGTSFFYARTFGATNDPAVAPGTFRLGVNADSAGAPKAFAPMNLSLSNWYTAVIKVDQTTYSNGVVTVWINPLLESDPSGVVTGTVASGYCAISTVAFRQATTEGIVNVDNLVVGSSFATVIPEPSTVLLVGVGLTGMLAFRRRRS